GGNGRPDQRGENQGQSQRVQLVHENLPLMWVSGQGGHNGRSSHSTSVPLRENHAKTRVRRESAGAEFAPCISQATSCTTLRDLRCSPRVHPGFAISRACRATS